jgi:predicted GNAT superfamily acetyltransferase
MINKLFAHHKYHLLKNEIQQCEYSDENIYLFDKSDSNNSHLLGYKFEDVSRLTETMDQCFMYKKENNLSGLMMGHSGPCYIRGPGIYLDLNENDVYIYWIIVDSVHRGDGIYKKLYNYMNQYYMNKSKQNIYYLVDCQNKAMLNIVNKQNFKCIDTISTYKIANRLVIKSTALEPAKISCYLTSKYANEHII